MREKNRNFKTGKRRKIPGKRRKKPVKGGIFFMSFLNLF
jgi:hypothetical protein